MAETSKSSVRVHGQNAPQSPAVETPTQSMIAAATQTADVTDARAAGA